MFKGLSKKAELVLTSLAQKEAKYFNASELYPEHILVAVLRLEQSMGYKLLSSLKLDIHEMSIELERVAAGRKGDHTIGDVQMSYRLKSMLEIAAEEARLSYKEYIGTEHFVIAAARESSSVFEQFLSRYGLYYEQLRVSLRLIDPSDAIASNPIRIVGYETASNPLFQETAASTSILDEFSRDLTRLAMQKKLDNVIGREQELQRLVRILSRRSKNNPILLGEPGVGKTAVAEGLAQKIACNLVPEGLKHKRLLSLDLAAIVAGTKYRGEFEERLKLILKEIKKAGNIIVFIDEIHTVIGAGSAEGTMDVSNILKPVLSRGEVQCIGATTLTEYRKYFEKDSALDRRFQPLIINEPSFDATVQILNGIKPVYEAYHGVKYTDDAIETSVRLSTRYMNRLLPDKAIDIMDEAGAINKISKKKTVSSQDIQSVVADITGIPVNDMNKTEAKALLSLESELEKKVVGQTEAVNALARTIRRSRAGISDPKRPLGSFVFLGPSGVGKTLLAKSLAEVLFTGQDSLIRIDMSDYMEKHSVSRLVGSPPGYVGYADGGVLTEKVRHRPYSIVLFDEFEKAHTDVFNILLQILEEGELEDNFGRHVSFRNCVIIITSNIGSKAVSNNSKLGFDANQDNLNYNNLKSTMRDEFKRFCSPEFVNRIDEILVFKTLTQENIARILDIELNKLRKRLADKGLSLKIDAAAIESITKHGFEAVNGARPLRRTITRLLEDPISSLIMQQNLKKGTSIVVEADFSLSIENNLKKH